MHGQQNIQGGKKSLEESFRLWWVVVCDLETSWMMRTWPTRGGGGLLRQIKTKAHNRLWSPLKCEPNRPQENGFETGTLKNKRGRQPKWNGPVSYMYGTV